MSESQYSFKERFFFGLNGFPDQMTYQVFQGLIFTFYFAVVGIDLWLMWLAYVLWGIWNAFNDPILGSFSDRKKYGKLGKRRFFILIAFVPLCLMMIFLFTVPIGMGVEFAYFLTIIILFELIYTLFDVNVKSLFPEMWLNEKERTKANIVLRIITIFAILFAFVFPSLFIPRITPGTLDLAERISVQATYIVTGVIIAVIVAVTGILFIVLGIREREEAAEQFEKRPGFFESLKLSFKNKTFVMLTLCNMSTWYILTMLPAIYPLYAEYVFGITAFLYAGMSLVVSFVVAAVVMPIHRKLGAKFGMRKAYMISLAIMIGTFVPYVFFSTDQVSLVLGFVAAGGVGFGISGILFYFDILMADIIDQDELNTGAKRSASFYGTNAFVHRFSVIFFISTVAIVFSGTSWAGGYVPNPGVDVVIGLKMLMCLFPAIAAGIAIMFLYFYDLHGEKLEKMRSKLITKA